MLSKGYAFPSSFSLKRARADTMRLQRHLCEWFDEIPGKLLLEQEKQCLAKILPGLFGYYLVQIGYFGCLPDVVANARIRNYIVVTEEAEGDGDTALIKGEISRLPIATDSVDAVLMPHSLDFSLDPHQVLREAERVLIPEGRVVIVGFNPASLWGMWHLSRRRSRVFPWDTQFLPLRRLLDWLSLLGFDVERVHQLMYRPPLRTERLMRRLAFLERAGGHWWPLKGGVYVVEAVKRVSTLTPVDPLWKRAPFDVLGARTAEPTTRQGHQ